MKPPYTASDCLGNSNEQCTVGDLAGCDCFVVPCAIAESYNVSMFIEQQTFFGMLSAHDPRWVYTTILGYGTGTQRAIQQSTTTFSSTLAAPTSAVPSKTTWYANSVISLFLCYIDYDFTHAFRELSSLVSRKCLGVHVYVFKKPC